MEMKIQEFYPTEDEQRLYDMVSNYLQADNLYALPASQRKLMTLILRRLLASSTFAISGTLEGLANKLEGIVKESETNNAEEVFALDFEIDGIGFLRNRSRDTKALGDAGTCRYPEAIPNHACEYRRCRDFDQ